MKIKFKALIFEKGEIKMEDDVFASQCLESFLRELKFRERTEATLIDYTSFIGHFYKWLRKKNILFQDVDKGTVKEYLTEQTSSTTTKNGRLRHLKAYFNFLVKEEYVEKNPAAGVGYKKAETQIKDVLQPAEVELMILYMKQRKDAKYQRNGMIMRLLYDSGLRISEILGITLDDLDTNNNSVKVLGKGKKWRVVYFGNVTRKELIQWLRKRNRLFKGSEYLFPSTKEGVRLLPSSVTAMFRDVGWIVLKKKVYSHLLRHSWASINAINGMPGPLLQHSLGHTSFEMTRRYLTLVDGKELADYYKNNSIVDKAKRSMKRVRVS